jgi:hypothetical protein
MYSFQSVTQICGQGLILTLSAGSNKVGSSRDESLMMEAVRTSETSVGNHFTRQYIPGDISEHHTRRRENLKSHKVGNICVSM